MTSGVAADFNLSIGSSWTVGGVTLTSIPVTNLLVILVGMPAAATALGWLLSGRDPAASPASRSSNAGHNPRCP